MNANQSVIIIFLFFFVLLFNPLLSAQIDQNSHKPLGYQSAVEKGLRHSNNKEYEEAINAYNEAISLNPNEPRVYNLRGYAYFLHGQYDQALANYDQAFVLKPGTDLAYQIYVNQGAALAAKQQYEKAIQSYNRAIHLNRKDPLAYNARGYVHFLQGKYEEAFADYDRALSTNPNPVLAYQIMVNQGVAWEGKQEYGKAIEAYSRAVELDSKNPIAYNVRGYAFFLQKNYDKAISDYNRALALKPSSIFAYQVYVNQGVAFTGKHKYEKAIQAYDRAIELDPKNPLAFNARGYAYFLQKKYDKALLDYDNAMTLKPNHILGYYIYLARGLIYAKKYEYSKAREAFKLAMKLNPNDKSAAHNLADVFLEMGNTKKRKGRLDEAIRCYSEAILIVSENPRSYAGRAFCNILKRDYQAALPDLQTACQLKHQNACHVLEMLQK